MTAPIDEALLKLDDYVRGHLADDAANTYEEVLFEQALLGNAPELEFRAGLTSTLQLMKARGTLNVWLTKKQAEEIQALGLRISLFEVDLEHPSAPNIAEDAELVIARVPLNLVGVSRIDAEVVSDTGRILKRMPDVSFDAADGAIYACCEAELARTAAASKRLTRLWAIGDAGRTLLLELPAA
jgi:hypothetical protein